jgi:hypothetical protein
MAAVEYEETLRLDPDYLIKKLESLDKKSDNAS